MVKYNLPFSDILHVLSLKGIHSWQKVAVTNDFTFRLWKKNWVFRCIKNCINLMPGAFTVDLSFRWFLVATISRWFIIPTIFGDLVWLPRMCLALIYWLTPSLKTEFFLSRDKRWLTWTEGWKKVDVFFVPTGFAPQNAGKISNLAGDY